MNFEEKAFKNRSIKEYLKGKVGVGDDDYTELQEFLCSLLTLFQFDDMGASLLSIVQQDWNLFSTDAACGTVLDMIISSGVAAFEKDGIKDARTLVSYKKSITDSVDVWEQLKEDIKNHHRFTTDLAKLENAGWKTLLDNRFQLNPGDSFYRARIHYKKSDVFGVDDMGAPKREDSKSGRANPEGIPFLYLSEDAKTTLYETRVIKHDVVTVGEFRMVGKDPLYVEDLTDIDLDDIELLDEDVVTLAKRRLLIRALSQDMSHPMRRFDSAVEYVPTQFICEYVQLTQSVTGIRFSSSVYPGGTNIVIFDPALMSCVAVKDYNIGELDINETAI